MKKLVALIAILTMCVSCFAACGGDTTATPTAAPTQAPTAAPTAAPTEAPVETVSDLTAAKNYLYTMYKDQNVVTPTDYELVGVVNIGGTLFDVEWSVAGTDTITITRGDNKMVTIDVDDQNPEEVFYVLTATVKDANGASESVSFAERKVPAAIIIDAGMSYAEIVDMAYAIEEGLSLDGTFRLFGTISKIDTAWSEDYQNISVVITVAGKEDKPILCYRLKGEGAKDLKVGDAITVEGSFKNYKGIIELDQGCVLIGMGDCPDQTAILDAAYAVADGLTMNAPTVLRGVISKIDTAWSDEFGNITVTIVVDGDEARPIMCYRLKGEGAKDLAVGDTIAVAGTIKNYKGIIEFDQGCVLIPASSAASVKTAMAAYGLEDGISMTAESTMTGVITTIDTAWSEDYQNITVTIVAGGMEDYKVQCYRLKGEGAKDLAVGDTITVTGIFKNYKGIIEFDQGCVLNSVVKAGATPEVETPVVEEPVEVAPVIAAADLFDAAKVIETATNMADDAKFAAALQGTVASIDTAYSEQYGNISVTINVAGTDKTLYCFRLKGEGVATLAVGDSVSIVGTISKYNGNPQFGAGCLLISADDFASVQAAVAAYALADGETIENKTITGVVADVPTAYSEQYGNVTVTIIPAGQEAYVIECFRMKGDIAATVKAGDVITVTGTLKNYKGKIEFDAGCVGTAAGAATPAVSAGDVLNVSELTAATLKENTVFGGFTVAATESEAVTIDANSKKSDTGVEFTQRLKFGGTGSLEARNISFTTEGAVKITVYAMSSSSSADRALLLMNAEGTELARGTALGKVDDSTIPAIVFEITEAGTYYLWSEDSGINIYLISVE